jgi:hypothetical protein
MVVVPERKKGVRPDFGRTPQPLEPRGAAAYDDRPVGDTTTGPARKRNPLVDRSVASICAGIAVVDISDDATTNYRAQNRSEDGANV